MPPFTEREKGEEERKEEGGKCDQTGKAENVSQKQGLVPRLGGQEKAAERARAGIFEVGLPRAWGGGEWLLLVDLPPQNYFMLCDASLAKEKVISSERRCQEASMDVRAEILFCYPGHRSPCSRPGCTGTKLDQRNCNCEYLRHPFFILRNWDSFLENHKNLLKRRPRDVTIGLSASAELFLEHILIALFSYILKGQ